MDTGSLRFILVALALIGLLIAALRLVKTRRGSLSAFTVLHYLPMGPRRGIAAVKVYNNEVLILGVTPQSIQLLRTYSAEEIGETGADAGKPVSFGDLLGRFSA